MLRLNLLLCHNVPEVVVWSGGEPDTMAGGPQVLKASELRWLRPILPAQGKGSLRDDAQGILGGSCFYLFTLLFIFTR